MQYLIHLLVTVNIFVMLALALEVVAGAAGLASLATAAFFGIGAYSTAIMVKAGVHPLLAQGAGIALAALASAAIALPAYRVKGIFLLIITIAVQIVFTVITQNWISVTGGDAGISRIPPYAPFGSPIVGLPFLLVCCIFSAATYGNAD